MALVSGEKTCSLSIKLGKHQVDEGNSPLEIPNMETEEMERNEEEEEEEEEAPLHIVLFPFMTKGHTIPMLHLARVLLQRNISVTFITTPLNSPFIHDSLTGTAAFIISLPFPQNLPHIPNGIENPDDLPSISLFIHFANSTKLMQMDFELLLQCLPHVNCIISDGFLTWTHYSAERLGVPRIVFYGMNTFVMVMTRILADDNGMVVKLESDDQLFSVSDFPNVRITKNDFDPTGPVAEFLMELIMVNMQSNGYLVNSFYEVEAEFIDYWNKIYDAKVWCVGPLCLAEPPKERPKKKSRWIEWLDEKQNIGQSVLYVAFGSEVDMKADQFSEIATGLERSQLTFLWVVRFTTWPEDLIEFEQRVKDRALIVKDWVDQVEILSHESVNGFMNHCGWNSVLESICESVPILACPMIAEQQLNTRLIVDQLGIGIRVLARNGSVRGLVGAECVEEMAKELMEGEKGEELRKEVKKFGEIARQAVKKEGSSFQTLDKFLGEVCM